MSLPRCASRWEDRSDARAGISLVGHVILDVGVLERRAARACNALTSTSLVSTFAMRLGVINLIAQSQVM